MAFPLISSGAFGWPLADAVTQALRAMRASPHQVTTARLVLFDEATRSAAEEQLGRS